MGRARQCRAPNNPASASGDAERAKVADNNARNNARNNADNNAGML
jgi:hypothetical protein